MASKIRIKLIKAEKEEKDIKQKFNSNFILKQIYFIFYIFALIVDSYNRALQGKLRYNANTNSFEEVGDESKNYILITI